VNSSDAKLRVSSNASFVRNITVNADTNASGVSGNRAIEFANAPSTTATLSGTLVLEKSSSVDVAADATGVLSGAISGAGGLTKGGNGTLTFSGVNPNTYGGTTTVSAGTLRLSKTAGVNAIAGAVAVNAGATLLLSASENVTNISTVTLSGGTISRGSGVSETFGDLNLTANSFLNYGSVAESKLIQFGSLSMGAFTLGVTGFADLNQLAYTASSFSDGASKLSSFTFDNSYTTSFSGGTFTITAIPETSTMVAVLGLLALCGFPLMRGRSRRNLR
jgi:autotransporter-associated beta strand protein